MAVLLGVITATFGGVLRDIVCNEVPTALRDHQPYAVCAFAGGWVLVGAQQAGLPAEAALVKYQVERRQPNRLRLGSD